VSLSCDTVFAVRFLVLGPLQVLDDDRTVPIEGRRLREVLACLLADPNQIVSVESLVDRLWPGRPPGRPAATVQVYVGRLRALLEPGRTARARDGRICTEGAGYRLTVDRDELDLFEFERLVEDGREALRAGSPEMASDLLRRALGLWRGPVLADLDVDALTRDYVPGLTSARLGAVEDRVDADLQLGRHGDLAGELTTLVEKYPERERLRAAYLVALYRCGRKPDALANYDRWRRMMRDEQGLDPGLELQRTWQDIIVDDPRLAMLAAGGEVGLGCQLPAALPDFVGREAELARLSDQLARPASEPATVPVVGISGEPGLGKTAFAVRLAHGLRSRYPDGQLYVVLHGCTADPAQPGAVLADLLGGLGVTGNALPAGVEQRGALLRARLTGRQVLLVLDDAAGAAQVRPLLPSNPDCAVIVTSRRRLIGLPGVHDVSLPLLDDAAATELVRRCTGDGRSATDPDAEAEIVRLCGGLPLALRIAGSRLVARPHWSASRLRDALRDEQRRLDELTAGDLAVRASIATSWQLLSPEAALLLRRFGLAPAGPLPAWAAAPLLAQPLDAVEATIEELIDARLLDPIRPAGPIWAAASLRLHDLTRLYAREQAMAGDSQSDREEALTRLLQTWRALVREAVIAGACAAGIPEPGTTGWSLPVRERAELVGSGLGWLDAHRGGVRAAIDLAARTGQAALATELTLLVAGYYSLRGLLDDWQATATAAHAAALRAGCRPSIAGSARTLGELLLEQGDLTGGSQMLLEARTISAEVADPRGHALAQLGVAFASRASGDLAAAEHAFHTARAELEALGDVLSAAHATAELGLILQQTGRPTDAEDHLHTALHIFAAHGYSRAQAQAHRRLGTVSLSRGRYNEAIEKFGRAARMCAEVGDRRGQAEAIYKIGSAALDRGDLALAESHLDHAAALLHGIGDHRAEAYTNLVRGQLYQRTGRAPEGRRLLLQALDDFRAFGDLRGAELTCTALGAPSPAPQPAAHTSAPRIRPSR
jgi:DNA-binding SARP family transcriptional activator/tetratricopeptide (TPR) repeat protein